MCTAVALDDKTFRDTRGDVSVCSRVNYTAGPKAFVPYMVSSRLTHEDWLKKRCARHAGPVSFVLAGHMIKM